MGGLPGSLQGDGPPPADAARRVAGLAALLLADTPVGENAVLSPLSVMRALALAGEGARGESRRALVEVVGDGPGGCLGAWGDLCADLEGRYASADGVAAGGASPDDGTSDARAVLRMASALWVAPDVAVRREYAAAAEARLRAPVIAVDFRDDGEATASRMNAWVAKATGGLIPRAVPEEGLPASTRVALTDALHFRAAWPEPLGGPIPTPFHPFEGPPVECGFVGWRDHLFRTAWDAGTAVALAYSGGQACLVLLLPREPGPEALERLQRDLAAGALRRVLEEGTSGATIVRFPVVDLDAQRELTAALSRGPLAPAFSASADLGDLSSGEPLRLDALLHAARLRVDENGTEGAAATVMGLAVISADEPEEPLVLVFDRPFLLAVLDRPTGVPFFVARVAAPR